MHHRIPVAFTLGVSLLGAFSTCDHRASRKPRDSRKTPLASQGEIEVTAHTSGVISVADSIRVAFSDNLGPAPGPIVTPALILIPEIPGTLAFIRRDEIEFRPDTPLPAGQTFEASVEFSALGLSGKSAFRFSFATRKQSAQLISEGISFADDDPGSPLVLTGLVTTADVASTEAIEMGFTSEPKALPVAWRHDSEHLKHHFSVTGIKRRDFDQKIVLRFDSKGLGLSGTQSVTQSVPGLENFSILSARAVQDKGRHVELRFSDRLRRKQDLGGLVTFEGRTDARAVIRGNLVEIHARGDLSGEVTVNVHPGIENERGKKLRSGGSYRIEFVRLMPEARFVGTGTIVPSSENLVIPIETANLRRVTVEAMRVPDKNLPQFFQVNRVSGNSELRRVGRVVWKKTLTLGQDRDLKETWTRHGLDLANLVKQERAGLIRLRLSFGPSDILFDCSKAEKANLESIAPSADDALLNDNDENEGSYWNSVSGDWDEMYNNRGNPCHLGYYRNQAYYGDGNSPRSPSRNVVLSDLGILAKRGMGRDVLVVVTDLKTTQPRADAVVTLVDYQQQILATGRTSATGQVQLKSAQVPFLVVAEHRGDRGYLRMDEGDSLNTAHFDTGGDAVSRGLKGFFYGERGVWRPGDVIHLTFVLSDRDKVLPEGHPLHFALTDPRGKVVRQEVVERVPGGFHVFELKTASDAVTGLYVAHIKVGGVEFNRSLRVEAIRPNRMKIGLETQQKILSPTTSMDGRLTASWLHGSPASDLQAKVEVSLQSKATKFAKYQEYRFDDPTRAFQSKAETLFEAALDGEGRASIEAKIPFEGEAPGMLTASFVTRVFEESGGFSVDRHELPFSPYPRYVGLRLPPGDKARAMLLTDEKHTVDLVAVDASGNRLKQDVDLRLELLKVSWRWWWEKGDEDLSTYASGESYAPIHSGNVKLKNGEGQWSFEIKYPDWGRYLVVATDKNGKHRAGWVFYCDWPGWAGRARKDQPGGVGVLPVSTDKASYTTDDVAILTIPAAVSGRALVSVENGRRVLSASWIELHGKSVQHRIAVTRDMSPNVYANVTLIQPHVGRGNDLPLRLHGIAAFSVVDPASKLNPVLKAPPEFAPGQQARVTVSESAGRAMTYTVAIVDEGLLGLTRFRTPNPWDAFFAREALGVKTWDLFDDVVGTQNGRAGNLLAIGGGEDEAGELESPKDQQRANRFPPMALFAGPFTLKAGEHRDHTFTLPPYVGAVRTMVVAGDGKAYGATEANVFVRKPLFVLADLPRVLGPGEELSLPVAVFALEKQLRSVSLKVSSNERVQFQGPTTKTIAFKTPGDQLVPFRFKVGTSLGVARFEIEASSGTERATHVVEVDIRHPGTAVTRVVGKFLKPGETWTVDALPLPGMRGTNQATLELSRIPPLDLERHLGYLIRYPHGCVEQTTAAAFPQLYLGALVHLDDARTLAVDHHIKQALERLERFQQSNGGFGYWPTDNVPHDWASSWVGHFIIEARRAGYRVSERLIERWVVYQQNAANAFRPGDSDVHQAYRLFTLANAEKPALPAMNRLRQSTELSVSARWRLAAAYQLAGQAPAAKALVANAPLIVPAITAADTSFSTPMRESAMILETLALMNDPRAAEVALAVSTTLTTDAVQNTQAAAFGLVAMHRWAKTHEKPGDPIRFVTQFGSQSAVTIDSDRLLSQTTLPIPPGADPGRQSLVLTNRGSGGFARVIMSGMPAAGEEKNAANGLKLSTRYQTLDGKPIDITRVTQGTDLKIEVTVSGGSGRLNELALTHLLPTGFELRTERLSSTQIRASSFDYQDLRDDRMLTYFDLDAGGSKTFELIAHAAYPGRYYLPPVHVEAMYTPTTMAHSAGKWISIVARDASGGNR
jgi:alpha-2-macroglobulin